MSTIYLVTAGEYSDYRVLGVYDDKKLAQMACDLFNKGASEWDAAEVEYYPLNPHKAGLLGGHKAYFVRITKGGEASVEEDIDCWSDMGGVDFDINGNMYTSGLFKDKEHAIKSTNEKRLMLLAEGRWGHRCP